MTIGKEATTSFFRKQKLNAKSSTQAELIGINDGMANVLWAR